MTPYLVLPLLHAVHVLSAVNNGPGCRRLALSIVFTA